VVVAVVVAAWACVWPLRADVRAVVCRCVLPTPFTESDTGRPGSLSTRRKYCVPLDCRRARSVLLLTQQLFMWKVRLQTGPHLSFVRLFGGLAILNYFMLKHCWW